MRKRTKTIQTSLFFTYSFIILLTLVVFVSFFYYWMSNLLTEKAFASISDLSTATSEKLDIEVQKMNAVSLNVLYSNIVKDRFEKYISDSGNEANNSQTENNAPVNAMNNTKELIDILFAIIGPNRPVQQIYLYDFNGKVFGTGSDNRQRSISVKEKAWYEEVMNLTGKRYLSLPQEDDELSKFVSQTKNLSFISLCRIYYDNYDIAQGIVEVKQFYDVIFQSILQSDQNKTNEASFYVYNSDGALIYPQKENPSAADLYYFELSNSNDQEKSATTAYNPSNQETELLNYTYSAFTGWTTVVVVSEKALLAPVFDFTRVLIIVSFIILLFALGFSFIAAKKITVPIAKLHKVIKATNLASITTSNAQELNIGLNELEDLNQAFLKMNSKVKQSLDELILSQQHEMQSRMLALQSQMNPHFLYNTLANISVMAEEEMNPQIVEMCSFVSDMLRYISSDKSPLVRISAEIDYTEKYLACMKFRYGDKFTYAIDLGEEMYDIFIPKLVIQPLTENALKFGTRQEPPWNIRITGHKTNTNWEISVMDNGPGFLPESLDIIQKKIQEIDKTGLLPSLELEGMGLLNIYVRLKLTYKSNMVFQVAESTSGGAMITIGGEV